MAPQTRSMSKRLANASNNRRSRKTPRSAVATSTHRPKARKGFTKKRQVSKKPRTRTVLLQKPTFRLLDLPQVIIDMIYIQILRAGDVAILRTSHHVSAHALPYLPRHGFYRIVHPLGSHLSTHVVWIMGKVHHKYESLGKWSSSAPRVHNIQIRICDGTYLLKPRRPKTEFVKWRSDHSDGPMRAFTDPDFRCDTCHIIVETDMGNIGDPRTQDLLKTLGHLTGCDTLLIHFKAGLTLGYSIPYARKTVHLPFFEMVKEQLEPTLGPSTRTDDSLSRTTTLTFRPFGFRSNQEENVDNQVAL